MLTARQGELAYLLGIHDWHAIARRADDKRPDDRPGDARDTRPRGRVQLVDSNGLMSRSIPIANVRRAHGLPRTAATLAAGSFGSPVVRNDPNRSIVEIVAVLYVCPEVLMPLPA